MQIIKHFGTHPYYQTHIVRFSVGRKHFAHSKHTMAWHVMQGYCAQQRSLEGSRLQLFLHGGERVNRTVLLYSPFNSNEGVHNTKSLNYVVPAGVHVTLEELRALGKLQNKQVEFYSLPRTFLVLQQNGGLKHTAWEASSWLSRPQWTQFRQELLSLAVRLLMRRGVQSELAEVFVRRLSQVQASRLQSRLENFHPQDSAFSRLQRLFIHRYGEFFLSLQSANGIVCFRDRVLPGLQDSRRVRRHRGKLRGLLFSRGLFEARPRLGTSIFAEHSTILVRPQQVPFLNMLILIARQSLRSEWRRRRGVGLLHRVLRKSGRLFWDLPVATYAWPLHQRSTRMQRNVMDSTGFPIYATKGVYTVHNFSTGREFSDSRRPNLVRAFPFLFSTPTIPTE